MDRSNPQSTLEGSSDCNASLSKMRRGEYKWKVGKWELYVSLVCPPFGLAASPKRVSAGGLCVCIATGDTIYIYIIYIYMPWPSSSSS